MMMKQKNIIQAKNLKYKMAIHRANLCIDTTDTSFVYTQGWLVWQHGGQ